MATKEDIESFKNYLNMWFSPEWARIKVMKDRQRAEKQALKDEENRKREERKWDREGWDFWVNLWEDLWNLWENMTFKHKNDDAWYESVWKFFWNIPASAAKLVWGWISMVSNPVWTARNLKEVWWGLIENASNKIFSTEVWQNSLRWLGDKLGADPKVVENNLEKMKNGGFYTNKTRENIWKGIDNFWNDLKNDTWNTLKKLVVENPADILTLWYWTATNVGSKASKIVKLADAAWDISKSERYTKVANIANKTADILNPLNYTIKPLWKWIDAIKEWVSSTLWMTTWAWKDTIKNAFKYWWTEDFKKAFSGEIEKEDILARAKNAFEKIKDERKIIYWQDYEKLKQNNTILNIDDIKENAIKKLEEMRVWVFPDWKWKFKLDFSNSTITQASSKTQIKEMLNDLANWKDKTAEGLDILKQRLQDRWIGGEWTWKSDNLSTFLSNSVKDKIVAEIPEYAEMTKKYQFFTNEIKEIDKVLSLSDKKSKMTAMTRLNQTLKNNTAFRKEMLEKLEKLSWMNLKAVISGSNLSEIAPIWWLQKVVWTLGIWFWAWVSWWLSLPAIASLAFLSPKSVWYLARTFWTSSELLKKAFSNAKALTKIPEMKNFFQSQMIADKIDNFASKSGAKLNFMPEGSKSTSLFKEFDSIKLWELIPDEAIKRLENSLWTSKNEKLNINLLWNKTKKLLKENWMTWVKGHRITSNWIRHIDKRHWKNAKLQPNEVAVTMDDIKLIPKIIKEPDEVMISNKLSENWEKIIIYKKTMWKKYYYLESVDDKSWYLTTKTMYINK